MIIVHTELNKIHLLKNLKVHIDNFLTKGFAFQKADQFLFSHYGLEVFKYFSELKWVPLLIVLWELEWLVGVSGEKELLVLFVPVLQNNIIVIQMRLLVVEFGIFRELHKLVCEHIVKKLF